MSRFYCNNYKPILILFLFNILFFSNDKILAQSHEGEEDGWKNFINRLEMPINGRFDYRSLRFGNDSNNFLDDKRFQMSSLLFMLNGRISDNFTFNYRQAFNRTGVDDGNLSNNIQVATLNYTTNNNRWLFKVGKFFFGYGTMEQQYWPYDVYRYSYVNNNVRLWKTGVHAEHVTKSGQKIAAQIVNGVTEYDSLGNKTQALQYNIFWWGHIVKDFIKVYSNATTLSGYNQYNGMPYAVSFGIQLDFKTFWIDTDFITARNMPAFNKNGTYYSAPIKLKYNGDHFRPFIKVIIDNVSFDSEDDAIVVTDPISNTPQLIENSLMITYELALEYYPWKDKEFNLHAVATYGDANNHYFDQINDDPSSRNRFQTQLQILVGCSFGFNALDYKKNKK